jgi:hypothetical protein
MYIYTFFLKHHVIYIARCFRKYGFLMLLQLATIVTIRPCKFKDTVAAVNLTFYTPPTAHSNQFQLFHESSRQQYGMYIIHYSVEHIAFSAEYTTLSTTVVILI